MDVKQFGMKNLNRGRLLNSQMQKTMEKLASGTRINRAADDAAGLAVSEKLRVELSEQQQCVQNVRHGTNLARTADAALQEVNDMMKRAEGLCLQAANGTYSELERQELTDELNALYDEMERIFSSAEYSDIKLFRFESPEDVGDFPRNEKEYIESVQELLPEGTYEAWGALSIVKDKEKFSSAEDAKGATATLQLGSDIKLNDASTLQEKSFYIKPKSGSTVYVTFTEDTTVRPVSGSYRRHDDGSYYYDFVVRTDDCRTVEQAMEKLCQQMEGSGISASAVIKDATVSTNGKVTFTFGTTDLPGNYGYPMKDGDGTLSNGVTVFCKQEALLKPVDSVENKVEIAPGTLTVWLFQGEDTALLSEEEKAALQHNSIRLNYDDNKTIKLSDLLTGLDINTLTVAQIKNAIVDEINSNKAAWKLEASLKGSGIEITRTDGSISTIYIDEVRGERITRKSNQAGQSITNGATKDATSESGEEFTFSLSNRALPLTLKINGSDYTFYNSNDYPGMNLLDSTRTSNTSSASLLSSIASRIESAYGSTKVSCKVEGEVIRVTSLIADKTMNFASGITMGSVSTLSLGKRGLNLDDEFVQKNRVELTIPADVKELDGCGFVLGSTTFEFTTDDHMITDGVKVDIGDGNDLEEALTSQLPTGYTAKVDGNKLTIERNSSFLFSDGKTGANAVFREDVIAGGGTTMGKPSATIDFSPFNSENFDELYGKGFRVTCATCEGEFINVMFCNDKDQANFPPSFLLRDADGNVVKDQNGKDIEILNCVVELKNMSSGSDIVQSIVNQLSSDVLDHYTEVAVGTPSSVLVVRDKRMGDLFDETGKIQWQAELLTGVYTNCVYDLTVIEHTNPETFIGGPETNTTAFYGYCPIYAGDSEGKPEWIYVHLPNLSLENLKLDPPRPDLTDVDSIEDVRKRLRTADNVIGMARGQLGADQNRLDHAKMNLTVSAEQTADTYSRIRDLDMAEGMTEQVKLSILQQTQQSALAHIHQQGSEILKLMQ